MHFKKIKWLLFLFISILFFVWLMKDFKLSTGIAHTQINLAMAWLSLVTAIFGPIFGLFVGLVGHAIQDYLIIGTDWWSWVIADGLFGLLLGLVTQRLQLIFNPLNWCKLFSFNFWQFLANIIAWLVIAPLGDVLIYGSNPKLVFKQGLYAGIANFLVIAFGGTLLIVFTNYLVRLNIKEIKNKQGIR